MMSSSKKRTRSHSTDPQTAVDRTKARKVAPPGKGPGPAGSPTGAPSDSTPPATPPAASPANASGAAAWESKDQRGGYFVQFNLKHYPYMAISTPLVELPFFASIPHMFYGILAMIQGLERDNRDRDIMPDVDRKIAKPDIARGTLPVLTDFNGNTYVVHGARKDSIKTIFEGPEPNGGLLRKLDLCPRLVEISAVTSARTGAETPQSRSAIAGFGADPSLPCTCNAAGKPAKHKASIKVKAGVSATSTISKALQQIQDMDQRPPSPSVSVDADGTKKEFNRAPTPDMFGANAGAAGTSSAVVSDDPEGGDGDEKMPDVTAAAVPVAANHTAAPAVSSSTGAAVPAPSSGASNGNTSVSASQTNTRAASPDFAAAVPANDGLATMDFDALADEEPADAAGKAKDYDDMGASDFWDEFEKTFGRLRKDLERSWKAKLRDAERQTEQLREKLNESDARYAELEQRWKEEKDTNMKLWEKINQISKSVERMTKPLKVGKF